MEQEESERLKKCPFLGEWCIGDACEIRQEMHKNIGGVMRKKSMCAFNAQLMLLSEINVKTQGSQGPQRPPDIMIPGLGRN